MVKQEQLITGFSKLNKKEKLEIIVEKFLEGDQSHKEAAVKSWYEDDSIKKIIDEFSENTIADFHLPYGVVPNVLINGKTYCVPMVTEESSVVAAAAKSAKFWHKRGGFHYEVISTRKVGQVHLIVEDDFEHFQNFFNDRKQDILNAVKDDCINMEKRGGGVKSLELKDCRDLEDGYVQVCMSFETCDAMGANFINTVLEGVARFIERESPCDITIVMSILSNYTPDCIVKAWVECPVTDLKSEKEDYDPKEFSDKFSRAIRIATVDVSRATTHNKGIMNGVDSVVLATGNDFRAIEACAHTFAARSGQYRSLTTCSVLDDHFRFEIELPLAVGTVGGLTALHPLAKMSLALLQNPNASELMGMIAVTGLAQNFAAVRSLITTGIQKGHMKMHLMNMLNHMGASEGERAEAKKYFEDKTVSFKSVRGFLDKQKN